MLGLAALSPNPREASLEGRAQGLKGVWEGRTAGSTWEGMGVRGPETGAGLASPLTLGQVAGDTRKVRSQSETPLEAGQRSGRPSVSAGKDVWPGPSGLGGRTLPAERVRAHTGAHACAHTQAHAGTCTHMDTEHMCAHRTLRSRS